MQAHDAQGERTLPMTVANSAFLLERLGQDCAPSQFIRELTQNSIEGNATEIVWDVDWILQTLEGQYKLSIIDNGQGMTGEEMILYINQLSSSIHAQSHEGNFGVGAKIAAAPRNPHGLIYQSWKDGIGEMVHLWRDEEHGVYGLRQFENAGRHSHIGRLEDAVKPDVIEQHGTKVILMGDSEEDNTMLAPSDSPSPTKWLSRYLNTRYFRFPEGVRVRVREGWEYPLGDDKLRNKLRTIEGQEHFLTNHSLASGAVDLTGAKARWWILTDDDKRTMSYSGAYAANGHVAALYRDELYELVAGRSGMTRLQTFGVTFGHNRVVIYVEPDVTADLTSNTSRTNLLIGSEPMPWTEWAAEFRERMPQEIRDLMDEVTAGAISSDHRQSIKERLRHIRDLFRLSRYRPAKSGSARMDETATAGGSRNQNGRPAPTGRSSGGGRGGRAGSVYSVFLDDSGRNAEEVQSDPHPITKWITVAEETRQPGQIEDRAGEYFVDQNLLLINGDFRVFTDMVERWRGFYEDVPGVDNTVQEVVREWFEQALVEAVLGAQSLRDDREWNLQDIEKALSPEALTTAVLPRYHTDFAIRRSLGHKLGSLREKQAVAA
jgi:hypothetical protein